MNHLEKEWKEFEVYEIYETELSLRKMKEANGNIVQTTQFLKADLEIFPVSMAPSKRGKMVFTSSTFKNLSRSSSSMYLQQHQKTAILMYSVSIGSPKFMIVLFDL